MDKSGVEIMENIWYDEKKQAVFLLSIIFRTVELETNKNWVNVLTNENNLWYWQWLIFTRMGGLYEWF